jgi:hypothetical protein
MPVDKLWEVRVRDYYPQTAHRRGADFQAGFILYKALK